MKILHPPKDMEKLTDALKDLAPKKLSPMRQALKEAITVASPKDTEKSEDEEDVSDAKSKIIK